MLETVGPLRQQRLRRTVEQQGEGRPRGMGTCVLVLRLDQQQLDRVVALVANRERLADGGESARLAWPQSITECEVDGIGIDT